MVNQRGMMQLREEAVAEILQKLSSLSKNFSEPKLILIGGYALRAFINLSRYTRDCDFVVREKHLEQIKDWLDLSVESLHQEKEHGYLRLLKLLKHGKDSIKVSLDFMQGQVRGRKEEDVVVIDKKFVQNSKQATLKIGSKTLEVFVPDYTDYLILKMASARPSDIRDIAALLWKKGLPDRLKSRASEIVKSHALFADNIKDIVQTISDRRFVTSWRGTFVTKDFTEEAQQKVVEALKAL